VLAVERAQKLDKRARANILSKILPSGGADEADFVKFLPLLPRTDLYGDRSNKVVGVGHGFRYMVKCCPFMQFV
jgi:hypothetical protein